MTARRSDAPSAALRFTGHALLDVGIAAACALNERAQPEDLTYADLDRVSDFVEKHYFSGAFDPYLSVVFTNNSGYCGPNKVKDPSLYADVFRAHRVPPARNVQPAASGDVCVFSGLPASARVHRQHLPLFSADGVMNFRPGGSVSVPIAAPCLVALQFTPMGGRRAEGRMLIVTADDAELTLQFAKLYLDDNRRLAQTALPRERMPAHDAFRRELPMWDAARNAYKMADAKGPRSLVIHDITRRTAEAAEARDHPVALTILLISNSGQGPSLDVFDVPSGVVRFVRRAAVGKARPAWEALQRRFQPLRESGDDARPRRRRSAQGAIPGQAGWSRNPAFEDLCNVFEGGVIDRTAARRWLARYVMGHIDTFGRKEETRNFDRSPAQGKVRTWHLAQLFVEEVLAMKRERVEAIKKFADKIADYVSEEKSRKLYRKIVLASQAFEARNALVRAQRASEGRLFGLDEFANVWLHEDGDEYLVRDLLSIRLTERLGERGFFKAHPEEALADEADDDDSDGGKEAQS